MIQINAARLMMRVQSLDIHGNLYESDTLWPVLVKDVKLMLDLCQQLELPVSVHHAAALAKYGGDVYSRDTLGPRAKQLAESIKIELKDRVFLHVSPGRQVFVVDPISWFDPKGQTLAKFPDIHRDVEDACRCYGYEQ
jgi:hypothetical protein